ncbi:isochorismatase family protein [Sphaerotilus montanus]|uniref:isochorismatase family protein n=1 Tax=Sphaerotilus montanus TaxID=522889 RepID=UPI001C5CB0E4|nr:isochorismatase family protein [Sphaerotilus montanus]
MMQTTVDARRSLLLVVDVQARLAPAIDEGAAAVENNRRLLQAAQPLQVPVLVTEHYPQGLGATVEPLQAPMAAAGATVIEKIHFGATREPGFLERLRGFGRWPPVRDFVAITLGHVILGRDHATLARWRRHEQAHVRQYERWGLLFWPLYLGASGWTWLRGREPYRDNPFEIEARRAEAE